MLRVALLLGGDGYEYAHASRPGADPKPADDLTALQGNWKPLQCEYQGKPQMPADVMKQVTVVFDKNEYYLYFVDKDRKDGQPKVLRLALLNVSLDPTTSPKSITFEFTDGPLQGPEAPRHLRTGRQPVEDVLRPGRQGEADRVQVSRPTAATSWKPGRGRNKVAVSREPEASA